MSQQRRESKQKQIFVDTEMIENIQQVWIVKKAAMVSISCAAGAPHAPGLIGLPAVLGRRVSPSPPMTTGVDAFPEANLSVNRYRKGDQL